MIGTCSFVSLIGLLASPQDGGEVAERLAAVVERTWSELGAANLVVGVSLAGETVLAAGWGYADPTDQVPAEADSAFPAAALMPTLVALGALMLADEGDLALDDALSKHFGDVELGEQAAATVEQLLRHTSGLPSLENEALGDPAAWLAAQPLQHVPGTCASYSAANTYWLGRLLEARAGGSVADFVRERIAGPLGLEATGHRAARIHGRPLAEGRLEVSGVLVDDPALPRWFEAGELHSSALDLLALIQAVGTGGLASDEALQLLSEPAPLPDGTEVTYVGGFSRTRLDEHAGWSIGGSAAGGSLHGAWYPEVELGVVVLSTDEEAPLALVERRLVRAFLGRVGPELPSLELPAEVAERYVGGYFVGCLGYRVEARGGNLWVTPSDGRALCLAYFGGDAFAAADDPDLRVSFEVEGQRARALVLDEHGFVTVATRME